MGYRRLIGFPVVERSLFGSRIKGLFHINYPASSDPSPSLKKLHKSDIKIDGGVIYSCHGFTKALPNHLVFPIRNRDQ